MWDEYDPSDNELDQSTAFFMAVVGFVMTVLQLMTLLMNDQMEPMIVWLAMSCGTGLWLIVLYFFWSAWWMRFKTLKVSATTVCYAVVVFIVSLVGFFSDDFRPMSHYANLAGWTSVFMISLNKFLGSNR